MCNNNSIKGLLPRFLHIKSDLIHGYFSEYRKVFWERGGVVHWRKPCSWRVLTSGVMRSVPGVGLAATRTHPRPSTALGFAFTCLDAFFLHAQRPIYLKGCFLLSDYANTADPDLVLSHVTGARLYILSLLLRHHQSTSRLWRKEGRAPLTKPRNCYLTDSGKTAHLTFGLHNLSTSYEL